MATFTFRTTDDLVPSQYTLTRRKFRSCASQPYFWRKKYKW
jgi:hypothetical protein